MVKGVVLAESLRTDARLPLDGFTVAVVRRDVSEGAVVGPLDLQEGPHLRLDADGSLTHVPADDSNREPVQRQPRVSAQALREHNALDHRSSSSRSPPTLWRTSPKRVAARSAECGFRNAATGAGRRTLAAGRGGSAGDPTLDVVTVGRLDPGEHLAQLAPDGLDRVLLALGPQRLELRAARVLVGDEPRGERPGLDVREHGLHVLLDRRRDDPRAGHVVAVLGGVRDAPALLGDAALDHQVDDQLE